jgi:penicillin-binding protein 1A
MYPMKNRIGINHILLIIFLILVILFGVACGALYASFTRIDIEQEIRNKELSIPTNIYDRNGKLIAQIYVEHRELIPLRDIPQDLINAFLAYEDLKFYEHHGFNLKRLAGAIIGNIKRVIFGKKGYMQGASTITQQLAKRLFTESEKTIFRKLKELW